MTAARRQAKRPVSERARSKKPSTPVVSAAPPEPLPAPASPNAVPARSGDRFLAPALRAAAEARARSARIRIAQEQHARAMAAKPSLAEGLPASHDAAVAREWPSVSWELETPRLRFQPLAGRRDGGAYRTEYQPQGMVASLSIVAPEHGQHSVARPLVAWRPRGNERWVVKEKAVTPFLAKGRPARAPARELPELVLTEISSSAPAHPAPAKGAAPAPREPLPSSAADAPQRAPTARAPFGPSVPLPTAAPPACITVPGLASLAKQGSAAPAVDCELVLSDRADPAAMPKAIRKTAAAPPRPAGPASEAPAQRDPIPTMAEAVVVPEPRKRPAAPESIPDLAPSFASVPVAPAPAARQPTTLPPAPRQSGDAQPVTGRSTSRRFAKTTAAAEQTRVSSDGEEERFSHVVPQSASRAEDDETGRRWFWPRKKPSGD